MDLLSILGMVMAVLLIPFVVLIVYKAIPRFRKTSPKSWYIAAGIIAAFLVLISLSSLVEKIITGTISEVILLLSFLSDWKKFRENSMRDLTS